MAQRHHSARREEPVRCADSTENRPKVTPIWKGTRRSKTHEDLETHSNASGPAVSLEHIGPVRRPNATILPAGRNLFAALTAVKLLQVRSQTKFVFRVGVG